MVGERAYLLPPQPQHADRLTMLEERDRHRRSDPTAPASMHVGPRKLGLSGFGKIDHGDRLSIEKGATAHGSHDASSGSLGAEEVRAMLRHAVDGGAAKRADRQTTVVRSWTLNAHGVGIAEARCCLTDRGEHDVQVSRRRGDDAQHLGGVVGCSSEAVSISRSC